MFIVCFIDKSRIVSPFSLVVFDKITVCRISDVVLQSHGRVFVVVDSVVGS
jgi:hypothetical protein